MTLQQRIELLSQEAQRVLLESLRGLGLAGSPGPEGVRLAPGGLTLRGFVAEFEEHPHAAGAVVGVEALRGPGEAPIRVLQMGMGRDARAAVADGVGQWVKGVLPPIREVLAPESSPASCNRLEVATVDRASGSVTPWLVVEGPLLVLGEGGHVLPPALEKAPLMGSWLGPFAEIVSGGRLSAPRLTWVKAFLFREEDGETYGECLINNDPWPEGMAALQRFPWPPPHGRMGFKQFFVMVPGPPAQGPSAA